MSTFDSKQRKDEEKAAQEDRIQYVEELASAEDILAHERDTYLGTRRLRENTPFE